MSQNIDVLFVFHNKFALRAIIEFILLDENRPLSVSLSVQNTTSFFYIPIYFYNENVLRYYNRQFFRE